MPAVVHTPGMLVDWWKVVNSSSLCSNISADVEIRDVGGW